MSVKELADYIAGELEIAKDREGIYWQSTLDLGKYTKWKARIVPLITGIARVLWMDDYYGDRIILTISGEVKRVQFAENVFREIIHHRNQEKKRVKDSLRNRKRASEIIEEYDREVYQVIERMGHLK